MKPKQGLRIDSYHHHYLLLNSPKHRLTLGNLSSYTQALSHLSQDPTKVPLEAFLLVVAVAFLLKPFQSNLPRYKNPKAKACFSPRFHPVETIWAKKKSEKTLLR